MFTKESLKRLHYGIIDGKCNLSKVYYGDIAIGACSNVTDVKLGNSLDDNNRERFHRYFPLSIF